MKRVVVFVLVSLALSAPSWAGGGAEVGNGHQREARTGGGPLPKAGGPPAGPVPAPLPDGSRMGGVLAVDHAVFGAERALPGELIEAVVTLTREAAVESCGGELRSDGFELGVAFEACAVHGRELRLRLRLPDPTVARDYLLAKVWVRLAGESEARTLGLAPQTAPRLRVDGSPLTDAAAGEASAELVGQGATARVAFDETFTLRVVVPATRPLVVGRLRYVVADPGEIVEELELPSAGLRQSLESGRLTLEIPMQVPARFALTRELRFGELVFLDGSLRERKVRFPRPPWLALIGAHSEGD